MEVFVVMKVGIFIIMKRIIFCLMLVSSGFLCGMNGGRKKLTASLPTPSRPILMSQVTTAKSAPEDYSQDSFWISRQNSFPTDVTVTQMAAFFEPTGARLRKSNQRKKKREEQALYDQYKKTSCFDCYGFLAWLTR